MMFKNKRTSHILGENIQMYISDKALILEIYKEFKPLNNKKTENSAIKWTKDLNRHFTQENIQMTKMHMKAWSTSLVTGKMQIETTRKYYCTTVRKVKSIFYKTDNIPSVGESVEQLKFSNNVGRNA